MIHARTLVIAMIETARGLQNVEAIAAVPGIDVLWLGHFDLTNFLAIPGNFSHLRYRDAVKRIVAAAEERQSGRLHGRRRGAGERVPRPRVPHDRHRHRPGHAAGRDPAQHRRMAFQVGVTSDLFDQRGEPTFGRDLEALDAVDWEKLPPGLRAITPEHAAASMPYM